ncbi:MAG: para-aminobenzoate synthetase component 1 [Oleiphilaceae bacterium]|jgi:para-aminobenzoate synthetase component 1
MPKKNVIVKKNQKVESVQTLYSRSTIIKRFSELCELNNLMSDDLKPFSISKPSLLISSNDNNTDPSNRFSFFCTNPTDSLVFYDSNTLHDWQSQLHLSRCADNQPSEIPFHSGWLGYFSYPNQCHSIKSLQKKAIAEFNYYSWVICFDHLNSTLNLLGNPTRLAAQLFKQLQTLSDPNRPPISDSDNTFSTQGFHSTWNKSDYEQAFNKIQEYLKSGDCYQINLTQAHKAKYQGQATKLLAPLFEQMQPNFGGYFQGLDVELISLSPERFISIDTQGRLEAKPIKGTIRRSHNVSTDQLLINELINSNKNKAENLMIVDLLRNDLSRSALLGTVKVEKLFALESHPNVHHLVSTISAQLRPEINPALAISQAFPGGSITGAPKIRAMEIINELEAEPRSLYCGSLGYFSDSGNCDFNILIRNLEFREGIITCWGGGGITIDSEVNDEYEESITKIQRIMNIIEKQNPTH